MLDVWLLWLLLSFGGPRGKAAHTLLTRKLQDGHVPPTLLERAVAGHEPSLAELLPSLLALADGCVHANQGALRAAGGQLYVLLFRGFPAGSTRQVHSTASRLYNVGNAV